MAVGLPVKANYAAGDILTATNMNDLSGTFNNVATSYGQAAGKNVTINSSFQIWQRGTSFSITSTNAYTADRWNGQSAGPASTFSRQVTNDTTNLPFIQYCMRVQRNSGQTNTSPLILQQSFETINTIPFVGKTVTVSFYARKGANYSATSSFLNAVLYSGTGTDQAIQGTYTGAAVVAQINATLTTTWQRFSFNATLGTTVNEMALYFRTDPTGTAGAADYFEITGVQLEAGSIATPFQTASGGSIQSELAMCQRYYYRQTGDNLYAQFGSGTFNTTTTALIYINNPVTMRVKPTSAEYSTLRIFDAGTAASVTSLVINTDNNGATQAALTVGFGTAFTAARNAFLQGNGSASAYVGYSAEL